jgi:hypothetical protein
MIFVDWYLPYFRQWLITHPLSALLPFQPLFTESSCGDQLLAFPLSLVCLHPPPPLLCVSFQFLVYSVFCFVLFCLQGRGSVCPRGYAGLSQRWLGEYCMMLGAHVLVFQMSPKQVWSLHLVAQEPSCFLSVMWCGEALYRLGVQGVEVLILLGALFPCSSISERVLIYRTHAVCFCTLVAILDPSWILNSYLPLNILHYF